MKKFVDSFLAYVSESEQRELEKIISVKRMKERPAKTGLEWVGE